MIAGLLSLSVLVGEQWLRSLLRRGRRDVFMTISTSYNGDNLKFSALERASLEM